MSHKRMKYKAGLTLIELIISISFLGLVVLSAVTINLSADRFLNAENTQVRLTNEVALALERIARDIKLSFGNPPATLPANPAFRILDPGVISGNELQLRKKDIAPLGTGANDQWTGYRFNNANRTIEVHDDLFGGVGSWETLVENVVVINDIFQAIDTDNNGDALNDNVIRVEITCRQDPTQAQSVTNPEVTLVSTMHIQAVASR
ncbi:MAG: hypothetical protein KJ593_04435 [Candidatus Omnitrophica bacterium]|nr:hypothetical protein [Candidatus Omnitrophota bacterium]